MSEKQMGTSAVEIIWKILKVIGIVIGSIVVIIAAVAGIVYLAKPNEIESFTQFETDENNQPIELTYSFSGESCTLEIRIVASGTSNRYTEYETGKRILYFDKAKGSMWFMGQEFLNKEAVKFTSDKARVERNVSLKEIRMSKGQILMSKQLSKTEIVWIRYHHSDAAYFGFRENTYRK